MSKSHSNETIQEILKEDSGLRNELYSILNSMIKHYAVFDDNLASKSFNEYLHLYKILKNIASLPKNSRRNKLSKVDTTPPLSIEDLRIAELIRLLPLKLSTFEKKIKKRVEFLKVTDSDFIIMIFLEHILDLLKKPEFRDLVLTKKTPIIIDTKIKNSE